MNPAKTSSRKGTKKNKFTPEEDRRLSEAIGQFGLFDWDSVAERMPGRSSRQCRDRWNYYLNPDISNLPWTEEEERLLIEKYEKHGPRWAMIAKFFDGRSDTNVKNHHLVLKRRQARLEKKKNAQRPAECSLFPGAKLITTEDFNEIWFTDMFELY
jgi:hypothetical protein